MNDLIRRKDAIEAVYQALRTPVPDYKNDFFHDTMSLAVNIVKNIPSAEPERKWIPVSEALPEPWKEVLTTYQYRNRRYVHTAKYAGQNDENGHPLFCASDDEYAPDHYEFVYIAWMPLPKPWRGENEDA